MQYLILKLTLVVNVSQEGQGVAALLSCARLSSKTQFYYISNEGLLPFVLISTDCYHAKKGLSLYYRDKKKV